MYGRTDGMTDRCKPVYPPLFQSGGIIKFDMQPLDRGGKKVYIFRPVHMTKMAATPIYGKKLKNLLLQNR